MEGEMLAASETGRDVTHETGHGPPGGPARTVAVRVERRTLRHGAAAPRLRVLDALRFVAAITVVGYHYTAAGDKFWHSEGVKKFQLLRHFTEYGWLGINLFFLISGFVICMSSWDRGLGDYLTSRLTRLYPAYIFGVIFTTVVLRALPSPDLERLKYTDVLLNFTMIQMGLDKPNADGPYWTLWRELLFYVLFAIVVWRGVDYRRTVQFCVVWTVVAVLAGRTKVTFLMYLIDAEFSHYFIAGVAMYLIYRFGPNALLLGIVGFCWILAVSQARETVPFMARMIYGSATWQAGVAIITAFFAILLATALGWLNRVQWRWLTTAGALTYPLYLVHANAGVTLIYNLSPKLPKYLVLGGVVSTMLVLAWLVHRFVERPLAPVMRRALRNGVADLRANSPLSKSSLPVIASPHRGAESGARRAKGGGVGESPGGEQDNHRDTGNGRE